MLNPCPHLDQKVRAAGEDPGIGATDPIFDSWHTYFNPIEWSTAPDYAPEPIDAPSRNAIDWNDDVGEATERIGAAVQRVDGGHGVLLLTDMFGGTPTNLALALHEIDQFEIVTGVNLPMLIKFANVRDALGLHELAARIADQGRQSIHAATTLLGNSDGQGSNP